MALPPTTDTIAAIATAPGSGAVGVVRVAGPQSYEVADAVFYPLSGRRPSELAAGRVVFGEVRRGADVLDHALLLTFRAPASYTGQDAVEVQVHGGPAVLESVLTLCLEAGARQAGPGEFTLRAYLAGKLDLAQAEAVLDLVNASSEVARRNAAGGLTGALSRAVADVQDDVVRAYAELQAGFDYPEEGVPEARIEAPLAEAMAKVAALLRTAEAGRIAQRGARVAIIGRPNAGKSSLLNAMLGYGRSLVSDVPGTTRDYLEAGLDLGGIPVTLVDTAGMRQAADELEASGVVLARQIAAAADVRLVVIDGSAPLAAEDVGLLADHAGKEGLVVVVATKSDLGSAWTADDLPLDLPGPVLHVSSVTTEGVDQLKDAIVQGLVGDVGGAELWVGNARQVEALKEAERALAAALSSEPETAALDLQDALLALGRVTGRGGVVDETLASIFARFCVGK